MLAGYRFPGDSSPALCCQGNFLVAVDTAQSNSLCLRNFDTSTRRARSFWEANAIIYLFRIVHRNQGAQIGTIQFLKGLQYAQMINFNITSLCITWQLICTFATAFRNGGLMGPVHIQRRQVTITLFPADLSYQLGNFSSEQPRAVLVCRCYTRFLGDLDGASALECILRHAPLRTNGP